MAYSVGFGISSRRFWRDPIPNPQLHPFPQVPDNRHTARSERDSIKQPKRHGSAATFFNFCA
jgi:hypothetical protein